MVVFMVKESQFVSNLNVDPLVSGTPFISSFIPSIIQTSVECMMTDHFIHFYLLILIFIVLSLLITFYKEYLNVPLCLDIA